MKLSGDQIGALQEKCEEIDVQIERIRSFLFGKLGYETMLDFDIYFNLVFGDKKFLYCVYKNGKKSFDHKKEGQEVEFDFKHPENKENKEVLCKNLFPKNNVLDIHFYATEVKSQGTELFGHLLLAVVTKSFDSPTKLVQDFILELFSSRMFRELGEDDEVLENIFTEAIDSFISKLTLKKQALLKILSAEKYEKKGNVGKLVFAKELKDLVVKFSNQNGTAANIELKKDFKRNIRKLLEVTASNGGYALVSLFGKIVGIGLCDNYTSDPTFCFTQSGFEIEIENKKRTISFSNNKYEVFYSSVDDISKSEKVKDILCVCENKDTSCICKKELFINKIYKKIIEAKNGAVIVISENAKDEANRLASCKRGYLFETAVGLQDNSKHPLLSAISKIDGAVILDPDLNCYGMGFILDGMANPDCGSISRGSRYNSTCTYIKFLKSEYPNKKHLGIILSEDGGADYY